MMFHRDSRQLVIPADDFEGEELFVEGFTPIASVELQERIKKMLGAGRSVPLKRGSKLLAEIEANLALPLQTKNRKRRKNA